MRRTQTHLISDLQCFLCVCEALVCSIVPFIYTTNTIQKHTHTKRPSVCAASIRRRCVAGSRGEEKYQHRTATNRNGVSMKFKKIANKLNNFVVQKLKKIKVIIIILMLHGVCVYYKLFVVFSLFGNEMNVVKRAVKAVACERVQRSHKFVTSQARCVRCVFFLIVTS